MSSANRRPRSPGRPDAAQLRANGQLPVVGRFFPAPVAVKVPEIIFLFWVAKILTTAGGEVTSDYLKTYGNFGGGGTEVALFVVALILQFATRRYRDLGFPASRRPYPVPGDDHPVGGHTGSRILDLATQRGNAVDT